MTHFDRTVQAWLSDPTFQALPDEKKSQTISNYYQSKASPSFYVLPIEERYNIINQALQKYKLPPLTPQISPDTPPSPYEQFADTASAKIAQQLQQYKMTLPEAITPQTDLLFARAIKNQVQQEIQQNPDIAQLPPQYQQKLRMELIRKALEQYQQQKQQTIQQQQLQQYEQLPFTQQLYTYKPGEHPYINTAKDILRVATTSPLLALEHIGETGVRLAAEALKVAGKKKVAEDIIKDANKASKMAKEFAAFYAPHPEGLIDSLLIAATDLPTAIGEITAFGGIIPYMMYKGLGTGLAKAQEAAKTGFQKLLTVGTEVLKHAALGTVMEIGFRAPTKFRVGGQEAARFELGKLSLPIPVSKASPESLRKFMDSAEKMLAGETKPFLRTQMIRKGLGGLAFTALDTFQKLFNAKESMLHEIKRKGFSSTIHDRVAEIPVYDTISSFLTGALLTSGKPDQKSLIKAYKRAGERLVELGMPPHPTIYGDMTRLFFNIETAKKKGLIDDKQAQKIEQQIGQLTPFAQTIKQAKIKQPVPEMPTISIDQAQRLMRQAEDVLYENLPQNRPEVQDFLKQVKQQRVAEEQQKIQEQQQIQMQPQPQQPQLTPLAEMTKQAPLQPPAIAEKEYRKQQLAQQPPQPTPPQPQPTATRAPLTETLHYAEYPPPERSALFKEHLKRIKQLHQQNIISTSEASDALEEAKTNIEQQFPENASKDIRRRRLELIDLWMDARDAVMKGREKKEQKQPQRQKQKIAQPQSFPKAETRIKEFQQKFVIKPETISSSGWEKVKRVNTEAFKKHLLAAKQFSTPEEFLNDYISKVDMEKKLREQILSSNKPNPYFNFFKARGVAAQVVSRNWDEKVITPKKVAEADILRHGRNYEDGFSGIIIKKSPHQERWIVTAEDGERGRVFYKVYHEFPSKKQVLYDAVMSGIETDFPDHLSIKDLYPDMDKGRKKQQIPQQQPQVTEMQQEKKQTQQQAQPQQQKTQPKSEQKMMQTQKQPQARQKQRQQKIQQEEIPPYKLPYKAYLKKYYGYGGKYRQDVTDTWNALIKQQLQGLRKSQEDYPYGIKTIQELNKKMSTDSHKMEIWMALKGGDLSIDEYNAIHAPKYGEYGSKKFRKNFGIREEEFKEFDDALRQTQAQQQKPQQPPPAKMQEAKQPYEMPLKEYESTDVRKQRKQQALQRLEQAAKPIEKALEEVGWKKKGETIEQMMDRKLSQSSKYKKGEIVGQWIKTQKTALQELNDKWFWENTFKDKKAAKAFRKEAIAYLKAAKKGWFEKGEDYNSPGIAIPEKHEISVLKALKQNKLTPEEYNKLHALDYGEWGSERFKRNFPEIKAEQQPQLSTAPLKSPSPSTTILRKAKVPVHDLSKQVAETWKLHGYYNPYEIYPNARYGTKTVALMEHPDKPNEFALFRMDEAGKKRLEELQQKLSTAATKPQNIINDIEVKAKTLSQEEFGKFWNETINNLWAKDRETYYKVKDYFQQKVGKKELLASSNVQDTAKGISKQVYTNNNIDVSVLNSKLLKHIGEHEKRVLKSLSDFTATEYPNKRLQISIGEQPISISSKDGFRITLPTTDKPIDDMFLYDGRIKKGLKALEEQGVGRKELWAGYDWFHELAHSLGIKEEKACDRFALKMLKKWTKEAQQKFSTVTIKPQQIITRKDLETIFSRMKDVSTGQDAEGNFYITTPSGKKLTIKEVDHIKGHINTDAGRIPVGSYLNDIINLKTGGKGYTADVRTAWHEFSHFLEHNGFLSSKDIDILNKVIAKQQNISPTSVTEEHRADFIGERLGKRHQERLSPIKRILNKVADFANAIYEFFARTKTAKGVLRKIESGKILRAEPKPKQTNFVRYMYAGEKAKTADLSALAQAQKMKEEGKDDEQIWRRTGWKKGAEGKWRFEIDDSRAELRYKPIMLQHMFEHGLKRDVATGESFPLTDNEIFKFVRDIPKYHYISPPEHLYLPDVLKHDALYKAYPELKSVKVEISPLFAAEGQYDEVKRKITIDPHVVKPDDFMRALLHETQHTVQHIEGFARGGNTRTVPLHKAADKLKQYYQQLLNNVPASKTYTRKRIQQKLDQIAELERHKPELEKLHNQIQKLTEERDQLEKRVNKKLAILDDLIKQKYSKFKYYSEQETHLIQKISDAHIKIGEELLRKAKDNPHMDYIKERDNIKKQYDIEGLEKQKQEIKKKKDKAFTLWAKLNDKHSALVTKYYDVKKEFDEKIDQYKQQQEKIEAPFSDFRYDAYRLLAGEAEARDVSARRKLSAAKRRKTIPYTAEGIPQQVWIVVDGKGTSFSIEPRSKEAAKEDVIDSQKKRSLIDSFKRSFSHYFKTYTDIIFDVDYLESKAERKRIKRRLEQIKHSALGKKYGDLAAASIFYNEVERELDKHIKARKGDPEYWRKVYTMAVTMPNIVRGGKAQVLEKLSKLPPDVQQMLRDAENITPQERTIINNIQNKMDAMFMEAVKHGQLLPEQYIEDYVYQVYQRRKHKMEIDPELRDRMIQLHRSFSRAREAGTDIPSYSLRRFYDSFIDAMAAGKKPITLDYIDLAKFRTLLHIDSIARQMIVQEGIRNGLMYDRSKRPDIAKKEEYSVDYEPLTDMGAYKDIYVPRELKGVISQLYNPSRLRKIGWLKNIIDYMRWHKGVVMAMSAFHAKSLVANMLWTNPHWLLEIPEVLALKHRGEGTKAEEYLNKIAKVMPKKFPELKLPKDMLGEGGYKELLDFATRYGHVQVGKENMYDTFFHFSKALGNKWARYMEEAMPKDKALGKLYRFLRYTYRGFNKFLWDELHTSLKLIEFVHQFNKLQEHFPDVDFEKAARAAGKLTNAKYGGLAWEDMNLPAWARDAMQMFIFAPDWCVDAKTRAMTKTGWKTYDELEVGKDEILMFDPKTKKMRWGLLQDKYVNSKYDSTVICINNSIIMTPDHTCYVYDDEDGSYKVIKAYELKLCHSIPVGDDVDNPAITQLMSCTSINYVYYTGTIWCPSVETGFWLAEKDGMCFITGNTTSNFKYFTDGLFAWAAFKAKDKQLWSRLTPERKEQIRKKYGQMVAEELEQFRLTKALSYGAIGTSGRFGFLFGDVNKMLVSHFLVLQLLSHLIWHKPTWEVNDPDKLFELRLPMLDRGLPVYIDLIQPGNITDLNRITRLLFGSNTIGQLAMTKGSLFTRGLGTWIFGIDWAGEPIVPRGAAWTEYPKRKMMKILDEMFPIPIPAKSLWSTAEGLYTPLQGWVNASGITKLTHGRDPIFHQMLQDRIQRKILREDFWDEAYKLMREGKIGEAALQIAPLYTNANEARKGVIWLILRSIDAPLAKFVKMQKKDWQGEAERLSKKMGKPITWHKAKYIRLTELAQRAGFKSAEDYVQTRRMQAYNKLREATKPYKTWGDLYLSAMKKYLPEQHQKLMQRTKSIQQK